MKDFLDGICTVPGPHRKWLNSMYQGKYAQKEPKTGNISLICHSLIYSSCYGLLYLHPCTGTAATLTRATGYPQRDLSSYYYLQWYCYWLHGVTKQSCTTIYRYRPCNHSYHFPVQRTVALLVATPGIELWSPIWKMSTRTTRPATPLAQYNLFFLCQSNFTCHCTIASGDNRIKRRDKFLWLGKGPYEMCD